MPHTSLNMRTAVADIGSVQEHAQNMYNIREGAEHVQTHARNMQTCQDTCPGHDGSGYPYPEVCKLVTCAGSVTS